MSLTPAGSRRVPAQCVRRTGEFDADQSLVDAPRTGSEAQLRVHSLTSASKNSGGVRTSRSSNHAQALWPKIEASFG